jgi:hypothetical protein
LGILFRSNQLRTRTWHSTRLVGGISAGDSVGTMGGHDHFNWGFTAPGNYDLTFRAQ